MAQQQLSLVHLIREPSIRTAEPPPLLLLLHGYGSYEGDLMALAPELDGRFLVVSARAPLPVGPGAFSWYPVDFSTSTRTVLDLDQPTRSRDTVISFVEGLVRTYPVDANRVYLMGFSQGAIMSLGTALKRPDLVAGVVAMSGRLIPQFTADMADPSALEGLPILAIHGTEDQVLPVDNGRRVREFLEKLPVELTYREYQMGHQITAESLGEVVAWLDAHLGERVLGS